MSRKDQALEWGAGGHGAVRCGLVARELDLRGLRQPLPAAAAAQVLRDLERGEMIRLLTSTEATPSELGVLADARRGIDVVAHGACADGHVHILRRRLRSA